MRRRLTQRRPSASSASDTPAAADGGDTGGRRTGTAKATIAHLRQIPELPSVVTKKNYADLLEDEVLQTCPIWTLVVECLVDRTTAHRRSPEKQDANRKPR